MAKRGKGLEKKESSLMFREISPPHRWDQDLHSHYLRLTLPGFTNKDISLHIDKYGHLVVRGSHQATEHKYVSFEETFDAPEGADLEGAEGLFEDDHTYCITVPHNNKLGQTNGDGGSKSEGNKLDDHYQKEDNKGNDSMLHKHGFGSDKVPLPNVEPLRPMSVISKEDKSMKKIAFFLIAILVAMYVAWLKRDVNCRCE